MGSNSWRIKIRKWIQSIMAIILLGACSAKDDFASENLPEGVIFTIEVLNIVDGVQARSHIGGSTSGAGLYAGGEKCTVRAIPNDGYELESFTDEENKRITGEGYTFDVWVNRKFTAKFKKKEPEIITVTDTYSTELTNGGAHYYYYCSRTVSTTSSSSDISVIFTTSGDSYRDIYDQNGIITTKNIPVDISCNNGEANFFLVSSDIWYNTLYAGISDGETFCIKWNSYLLIINGVKVIDNKKFPILTDEIFTINGKEYIFKYVIK